MRIIFVRHGHPNYKNDCLTEVGHEHAKAVAARLSVEKIDKIYSSSCGRAVETAAHIGSVQGLDVEQCAFMREIGWGSLSGEPIEFSGHPWDTSDNMVARGQSIMCENWRKEEPFCANRIIKSSKRIAGDFDAWLETLGYKREGEYYRVVNNNEDTVAMVSHAGASSAVLSHLFNLPLPFMCAAVKPEYTAVTIVSFNGENGTLITPLFELVNDARHIIGIGEDVKEKPDN